jgi:ATP-dependent Clp protease ATP-binding subunit ClpC
LARAIQKYVEDPLAEEIINSKMKEGDIINISLDAENQVLKIDVQKTSQEQESPEKA